LRSPSGRPDRRERRRGPGIHSQGSDWPEDVIVAGGSVVADDKRGGIQVEGAEIVYPTAPTLAVAASRAGVTPIGLVCDDGTGKDRGGRARVVKEAASRAIASIAAGRSGTAACGIGRDHARAECQIGVAGLPGHCIETGTPVASAAIASCSASA